MTGDQRHNDHQWLNTPTLVGVASTVVAAGLLGAAKGVAVSDRRRANRKSAAQPERGTETGTQTAEFHHQTLRMRDGANIHVVVTGSAAAKRTVVLLHGITLAAALWAPVMNDLATDCRVIACDWRGHGSSTAGSEGFGLDVLAADLAEVLTQMDVRDAVVVGHSMGGMALMRFCGNHRAVLHQSVRALMFLSTAANHVGTATIPAALSGAVSAIASKRVIARRASWTPRGDIGYAMVRLTFGVQPRPEWVNLARELTSAMDPESTASSFVPLLTHDATAVLPTIDRPTMVVVGSKDRLTPPVQARLIAQLVPGAQLVEVDGAGHMIMLERQAQFCSLVRSLLE